jgi:hypothetical protein
MDAHDSMVRQSAPDLWLKWLFVVCVAGALGGVALSLGSPIFPGVLPALYTFIGGPGAVVELAGIDRALLNVAIAVGGGLQAGACIIIGLMARYPLRRGERWAWWACVLGLAAWLLLDTGVTALTALIGYPQLWPKIVNDLCFVVMFGLPYAALYRHCTR